MAQANPQSRTSLLIAQREEELRGAWDEEKNGAPFTLELKRTAEHWWLCRAGKHPHSFKRTVYKQLASGCPVCSGHVYRREDVGNDLATWCDLNGRGDLLASWAPENRAKPEDVSVSDRRELILWRCDLGHRWSQSVKGRLRRGCPSCAKKRLEPGYNDLETFARSNERFAHLLEEWDEEKNGPMSSYSERAGRRAHWRCSKGHRWVAFVSNRTAGNGCPKCQESQLEKEVRAYLEGFLARRSEKNRTILKGRELDIFFPGLTLAVEVNGDYWHRGAEKAELHRWKLEECEKKGITLLFVWESDWKERGDEVRRALSTHVESGALNPILRTLTKEEGES